MQDGTTSHKSKETAPYYKAFFKSNNSPPCNSNLNHKLLFGFALKKIGLPVRKCGEAA